MGKPQAVATGRTDKGLRKTRADRKKNQDISPAGSRESSRAAHPGADSCKQDWRAVAAGRSVPHALFRFDLGPETTHQAPLCRGHVPEHFEPLRCLLIGEDSPDLLD